MIKPNASNRGFASFLIAFSVLLITFPPVQLGPYTNSQAATSQVRTEESLRCVPGQILVKFKGSPSSELLDQYHLQLKERLDSPRFDINQSQSLASASRMYLVTFDESEAPEELAAQMSMQEGVEYAEPNYRYAFQVIPNDPMYLAPPNGYWSDGQWGQQRIGLERRSFLLAVKRILNLITFDLNPFPQKSRSIFIIFITLVTLV